MDYLALFNQSGGQNGRNHNNFQKNTSNGAHCTYYHQPGHIRSNCFELKNKFNRNSGTSSNDGQGHKGFNSNNAMLSIIAMKNTFSSDMWILDSVANCHYYRSEKGLKDVKEINESIKIGNDDSMKATKLEI
jgi:hypothetical protein